MTEQLSKLTMRTLAAYTSHDDDLIDVALREWHGTSLQAVFAELIQLSLNLRVFFPLAPGEVAELGTAGAKSLADATPGERCGAQMVVAGLNGDVQLIRDLIAKFFAEVGDDMLHEEATRLLETVFGICAMQVEHAADQMVRAEAN